MPIVSRIVADGKAKIITNSWGSCENRNSKDAMAAEEKELAAAFAAGISYFSASGDDAAYDCRRVDISSNPFERDITPGVDWPAASASVIAVGGTFLTVHQDGTYYDEAGWEEPLGGAGTGGGLSKYVQRPSWQTGTGVDNAQSNGKRQVPDVAGPADPQSGFFVLYTDPSQGQVSGRVGGTSAADAVLGVIDAADAAVRAEPGRRGPWAAWSCPLRGLRTTTGGRRVPRCDQGRQPALSIRSWLGLRHGSGLAARRAARPGDRRLPQAVASAPAPPVTSHARRGPSRAAVSSSAASSVVRGTIELMTVYSPGRMIVSANRPKAIERGHAHAGRRVRV